MPKNVIVQCTVYSMSKQTMSTEKINIQRSKRMMRERLSTYQTWRFFFYKLNLEASQQAPSPCYPW